MHINEIRYGRKFNTGSYESENLEICAAVSEKEDPSEVLKEMMEFVIQRGNVKIEMSSPKEPTPAPVVEKAKKTKTNSEATRLEALEKEAPAPVAKAEPAAEAPKAAAPEAEKEKPKVKVKQKASPYDRNLELHKKLFSEMLDVRHPGWKKDSAKAATISRAMVGKDFLDAEGMKVKSFIEEVDTLMKQS